MQFDFIAKEFWHHDYCYNILTKLKGKKCNENNSDDSESDCSGVENFILTNVLENHQAISSRTLTFGDDKTKFIFFASKRKAKK